MKTHISKSIKLLILFFIMLVGIVTIQQIFNPPVETFTQSIDDEHVYLPIVQTPSFFLETFDGDPPNPKPWSSEDWDVTVHSRDRDTWVELETVAAQHGPNCEAPPATHNVTAYEDAVYQCKNHTMTAISAGGYGAIYRTPNQMVDFSNGTAVIQWDMSTARSSTRDWVDIWITPYEDHLQLPAGLNAPDLSGPPIRAIQVRLNPNNEFQVRVYENYQYTILPRTKIGYQSFLEPSSKRRDTFEIRISKNRIQVGMPDFNFWWVDEPINLAWGSGIVQFEHASYNPFKACDFDGSCGPTTWHWDNISIQPAIPFTIINSDKRYVSDQTGNGVINFTKPSLQNSYLRFSGLSGTNIEVSFNGGSTWQMAQVQKQAEYKIGRFWSYWMPIPAGVDSVQFRGDQGWQVQDVSVWSR